jgi:hypothetical protein
MTPLQTTIIEWTVALVVIILLFIFVVPKASKKGEGFLERTWPAAVKKEPQPWDGKLQEVRTSLAPQPGPSAQLPLGGKDPDISSLEQLPMGSKIQVELTKIKGGKRISIVRGKMSIRPTGFNKQIFFFVWNTMAYYIRPDKILKFGYKKGKPVLKLVYDILLSEALNSDGSVTWDDELEGMLVDSGMDQLITATTFEQGFQITPQLIKAVIVVGVLGGFVGLALNGTLHFTPSTVIHWLPR